MPLTGQRAQLDGTDQTFSNVAIERVDETAPQAMEAA